MRFFTLAGELALVALATLAALLLRDNFETSADHLIALAPYLIATLFVSSAVFPALGVSRSLWRHTSLHDGLAIAAAAVAAALGAVMVGFSFNRLDGVPRSLPILQAAMITVFLLGARLAARLGGHAQEKAAARADAAGPTTVKTVLVVGAGRLADLYLRCIDEFAPDSVRVAGVLGDSAWQVGRAMRGAQIVGTADNLFETLKSLEVHGVFVDALVATAKFESFSPRARAALLEAERSGRVTLEFLAEQMELALCVGEDEDCPTRIAGAADLAAADPALALDARDIEHMIARPIWTFKRRIDLALSLLLIALFAPVMAIVAIGVMIDVGLPVTFWQQRPGREGRAFRLHKFRTMGAAHDEDGRRRSDEERLSAFGAFLRRSRLDELPQLFNILRGDMSFIGPRPLLPVDQPGDCAARLAVRPGLTGWAQVKGGRHVGVADKTALDLWYLRNASLWLEARIFADTARVVVTGDAVDAAAIEAAWRDLREDEARPPGGVLRPAPLRAVETRRSSTGVLRSLAAASRRIASGSDRS